ncbi:MAG: hypothetical protein ACHQF0_10100 [Chitinophagales bacterium]
MKVFLREFYLLSLLAVTASCHSVKTIQSVSVKQFATTAKEVSDLPYKIVYDYYTIKFKRKQLLPENYVTGDTETTQLDEVAEDVISKLEEIKGEYDENLTTASEIKNVYDLLQTYLTSLETLAGDDFNKDFKQKSADMGNKMNNLITKLNSSAVARISMPLTPGQWLATMATFHRRNELKAKQKNLLREYIDDADTLVQAINIHYHEIEMPIMKSWFDEEKKMIRGQFKRSIAPYLQNANRHPDSTASIVAFEFFSKINPVYYELTDEISKDQQLIEQTATMMDDMARTHSSLKTSFDSKEKSTATREEINELKEKLSRIKGIFNKNEEGKLSYYNLIQHEDSSKNTPTK